MSLRSQNSSQNLRVSQLDMMARARQGDVGAIAALMNRTRNKPFDRVQIRRREGGQYQLLVESAQVPEQQISVQWIVRGLVQLAIADIDTITIYGKSQQSAKPDWQQTVQIALSSPNSLEPSDLSESSDLSDPSDLSDSIAQPNSSEPPDPTELSDYCFIRNLSLLSGNLTPPNIAVSQIICSFAALPNTQKRIVLPHIASLLRDSTPIQDNALTAETQRWITEILALEGDDLRKLSIWLSRYCADPTATLEQIRPIVAVSSAQGEDGSDRAMPSAQLKPRMNPDIERVAIAQAARMENLHSPNLQLSQENSRLLWMIPAVWSACLLIVVGLGIHSTYRADTGFAICQQARVGASTQCNLAVQIAGDEAAIAQAIKSAAPVTPEIKSTAAEDCLKYGSTHILNALKLSKLALPAAENAVSIIHSQATEVFPGVLLTDITQTSRANAQPSRTACVGYALPAPVSDIDAVGDAQAAIQEIAADEIPAAWPDEPYQKMTIAGFSPEKALGGYDLFINLGSNVLFSAISVFVAVLLNACYTCYTLTGIYQVAAVLGALETVVHMIPAIGLFLSVPIGVGAIGLTSRFVKDFNISWADGYKPLARGAVTILVIKGALSWLLYGAIAHFIA